MTRILEECFFQKYTDVSRATNPQNRTFLNAEGEKVVLYCVTTGQRFPSPLPAHIAIATK